MEWLQYRFRRRPSWCSQMQRFFEFFNQKSTDIFYCSITPICGVFDDKNGDEETTAVMPRAQVITDEVANI